MHLDFELPIVKLEQQLTEMKQAFPDGHKNPEIAQAIKALELEVLTLKKNTYENLTRWQRVQLSRHAERPYSLDYIEAICSDFIELHGDRNFADDKAMIGGFGNVEGQTIMFVGQQKGRNTKQRQYRNFGMANPEGYRKALRLMKLAEKFSKPIVTLIDTPGAFPGIEAEERGQAEAIARNIRDMFMLKVPVICIIIGEGASGGAIGIGVGDRVLMLENTWYSVISPESCSSILWRSWDYKEQAAQALSLTAKDMLGNQLVDGIIPEPLGGAHTDPATTFKTVKQTILYTISELNRLSAEERINQRIAKFEKMGVFNE
jgi:acetyl-CoA carboxylase carboxyl transferase subunit alpha